MSIDEVLLQRPTGNNSIRNVLRYGIESAIYSGERALFDVLPGVGKSRQASEIAATGYNKLTILTNLRDNYVQYEKWIHGFGGEAIEIPTYRGCPTLRGDHLDDTGAEKGRDAYRLGWSISTIHSEIDLPCNRGNKICPYEKQVRELEPDGWETLIGGYKQAYVPPYIDDRVVIIDENGFDHFVDTISEPLEKADRYIKTLDEFPLDRIRRIEPGEEELCDEALTILVEQGLSRDNHEDSIGEFHAKAPQIAYAILDAERMNNGVCVSELPNGLGRMVFRRTGNQDDGNGFKFWHINLPDLTGAKAVIGLDATPALPEWRAVLGDGLVHYRLMSDERRNQYLREKGYEFIQVTSHVHPAHNKDLGIRKCEALLREIRCVHGQKPDLITSKQILERLHNAGLNHLWREDMHYGDLRGRNDIDDSELLLVFGSESRPDEFFINRAAFLGECAEVATDDNNERLGGKRLDFQNVIANKLLENVRKGGTFQAAMRAGRRPGVEAMVYVATCMLPDWLDREYAGRTRYDGRFDACMRTRTENERRVMLELGKQDGISGREISRRIDEPKSTVIDALNRLADDELVEKRGRGRGTVWYAIGLKQANLAGVVSLERMADNPLYNSIRVSRPISNLVDQPREPSDLPPDERYPDWMHDVLRARHRCWEHRQLTKMVKNSRGTA